MTLPALYLNTTRGRDVRVRGETVSTYVAHHHVQESACIAPNARPPRMTRAITP